MKEDLILGFSATGYMTRRGLCRIGRDKDKGVGKIIQILKSWRYRGCADPRRLRGTPMIEAESRGKTPDSQES